MMHEDIAALERAFHANEEAAGNLVDGLDQRQGTWRAQPDSWSIAECFDHVAIGNRVYLDAMRAPADRALAQGRRRRGPALPGLVGGWFVRSLEPPVRALLTMRAPRKIRPRESPPLADAVEHFILSQREAVAFLRKYSDIDLAGVLFPNPFVRGLHFSLATGLHVLAAHQRRHLWQAWNVRRAVEQTDSVAHIS